MAPTSGYLKIQIRSLYYRCVHREWEIVMNARMTNEIATISTPAVSVPALGEGDALTRYLRQIRAFPILSQEEEYEAAKSWGEHQDIMAAQKLITSHLRLVYKVALQFKGYSLALADLISEGNLGLMHAVKKFDYTLGYRFSTYAMWWIKASIQDFILKSWSMLKISTTAAKKKLFFNLQKVKNKIFQLHGGIMPSDSNAIIAKELDVEEKEVREMDQYLSCSSLNKKVDNSSADSDEIIDLIPSEDNNTDEVVMSLQSQNVKKSLIAKAMSNLDEREREVLSLRIYTEDRPKRFREIAEKYKISAERVRQIQSQALDKMKDVLMPHKTAGLLE